MKFELYFDGSCGPTNPGGTAAYGFALVLDGKPIVSNHDIIGTGPEMTNNLAEHAALYYGFRAFVDYVNSHKLREIELSVKGDSQLVIRQMNGEYKVRSKNPKPYAPWAIKNLDMRDRIKKAGIKLSFTWIPREQNTLCDDLSKAHNKIIQIDIDNLS